MKKPNRRIAAQTETTDEQAIMPVHPSNQIQENEKMSDVDLTETPAAPSFVIEDAVPPPPPRSSSTDYEIFPFAALGVGQSFAVPFGDDHVKTSRVLASAATHYRKKLGATYTTRKDDKAKVIRIWRKT